MTRDIRCGRLSGTVGVYASFGLIARFEFGVFAVGWILFVKSARYACIKALV